MKIAVGFFFCLVAVAVLNSVAGLQEQQLSNETVNGGHVGNNLAIANQEQHVRGNQRVCSAIGGKCVRPKRKCPKNLPLELVVGKYCSHKRRCCYPENVSYNIISLLMSLGLIDKVAQPVTHVSDVHLNFGGYVNMDSDQASIKTDTCTGSCKCAYQLGGCYITDPAPPGCACKCSYHFLASCGGTVVDCRQNYACYCQEPGLDYWSCAQGGGDCGGYCPNLQNHKARDGVNCDCEWYLGGCQIIQPAPFGKACRCSYTYGSFSCNGNVVDCKQNSTCLCGYPWYDRDSCRQGQGDCGGYCGIP